MPERQSDTIDAPPATDVFDTEEVSPEVIRATVDHIVQAFHPHKIILFGSRARDEADQHSDLDLLVVMPSDEPKRYRRGGGIDNLISPRSFPMDVVVYTPEEFEEAAGHEDYWFNPFIKDVLEHGLILYERETN